jgi:hypothetical protein
VLVRKFESAMARRFSRRRVGLLLELVNDVERFEASPVHELLDLLAL